MDILAKIKLACIQDKIPLVREQTGKLLLDLIKQYQFKTILEIGTAYGYSAQLISGAPTVERVVTLEKQLVNFQKAKTFLTDNTKVNLINQDAFTYLPDQKYDMIFIDGPKSHQDVLVTKYLNYLNHKGLMIIDNIFLKKFTGLKQLTKNQQHLLNNVKRFEQWLIDNNQINVEIKNIDDGVAIVCKR